MNADRILQSAEKLAAKTVGETHGAYYQAALAGALTTHVHTLCAKLGQFSAPSPAGSRTAVYTIDGGDLIVHYDMDGPDEEVGYPGSTTICGVFANGFDIQDVLSEEVMSRIEEHCNITADESMRDAQADRADDLYQSRKDDEMMGVL